MDGHPTAAIIGGGPRGVAVFERTAIRLYDSPDLARVDFVLFDDYQPGAGRVWRDTQSPCYLMNTVAGQVTLFSGPSDAGPTRPGYGPSLFEWLRDHPDPGYARSTPNTYAPRRTYGEYLRHALTAFVVKFPRPHSARTVHGRVIDVVPRGTQYELVFEDDREPTLVDVVVLATGHATAQLSDEEAAWLEFSAGSRRCRYQPGDAAADLGLEQIVAQDRVGVIGLVGCHARIGG
jgi:methylaspartate mutase epsilon subunit